MTEYERRTRSNSLFSALLNDSRGQGTSSDDDGGHHIQFGRWMDSSPHQQATDMMMGRNSPILAAQEIMVDEKPQKGINIRKKKECTPKKDSTADAPKKSGISASLAAAATAADTKRK